MSNFDVKSFVRAWENTDWDEKMKPAREAREKYGHSVCHFCFDNKLAYSIMKNGKQICIECSEKAEEKGFEVPPLTLEV